MQGTCHMTALWSGLGGYIILEVRGAMVILGVQRAQGGNNAPSYPVTKPRHKPR